MGSIGFFLIKTVVKTVIDLNAPDVFQNLFNDGIDTAADHIADYLSGKMDKLDDKLLVALNRNPGNQEVIDYLLFELKKFLPTAEYTIKDCSSPEKLADALIKQYQTSVSVEYSDEIKCIFRELAPELYKKKMDNENFVNELASSFQETDNQIAELKTQLQSLQRKVEEESQGMKTQEQSLCPDRTEEYRSRWNENMFLNNYNERDEYRGTNIKLSQLYQLPQYIWKRNHERSNDLEKLLCEDLGKPLLILGQPGIGKSTLISWFLAKQSEGEISRKILVYRFPELKLEHWNSDSGSVK